MLGKSEKKAQPAAVMPVVNVTGISNRTLLLSACILGAALLLRRLLAAGIIHYGLTHVP